MSLFSSRRKGRSRQHRMHRERAQLRRALFETFEDRILLAAEITNQDSLTMNNSDRLFIEIGGTAPGTGGYDQVNVTNLSQAALLNGALEVEIVDNFVPSAGQVFNVLTYGDVVGGFDDLVGLQIDDGLGFVPIQGPTSLRLVVFPANGDLAFETTDQQSADDLVGFFQGTTDTVSTSSSTVVRLADYVHVSGNLSLSREAEETVAVQTNLPATATALLGDFGETISNVTVGQIQIGASDVNAFVGGHGPYWRDLDRSGDVSWSTPDGTSLTSTSPLVTVNVDGTDVQFGDVNGDGQVQAEETAELDENASGFWIEDFDFGLSVLGPAAPFTIGGVTPFVPAFIALKANADTVALVGNELVTAELGSVEVNFNTGTAWPGGLGRPAIDFAASFPDTDGTGPIEAGLPVATGGAPVRLDYDGESRVGGSIDYAELAISEYVHVTGGIAFEQGPQHLVSVGTGLPNHFTGAFSNLLSDVRDTVNSLPGVSFSPTLDAIHGIGVSTTMQFGASDVHAFVGAKGPYWKDLDRSGDVSWTTPDGTPVLTGTVTVMVNGDDVEFGDVNGDGTVQANETAELNEDASGLWIEDFDFGYASFETTLPFLDRAIPGFSALKASADRVELIGVNDITASLEGIEVHVNDGGNWFGIDEGEFAIGPSVIDFETTFGSERVALFDTDPDGVGPLMPDGVVIGQEVLDVLGLASLAGLVPAQAYDDEQLLALFDGIDGNQADGLLQVGEVLSVLIEPVNTTIVDAVIAGDTDNDGKFDPAGFEVNTGGVPVYFDYNGNQRIGGSVRHAELAISEYVHITGGVAFEKGPQQLVSIGTGFPNQVSGAVAEILDPIEDAVSSLAGVSFSPKLDSLNGLDVSTNFQFGASDVHAFVGAKGPYWTDLDRSGEVSWTTPDGTPVPTGTVAVMIDGESVEFGDINGDGIVQANETAELNEDASGLWIEDFDFGYASFGTTLPYLDRAIPGFTALKATADSVELIGVNDITATLEGIEVNLNDGGNWFERTDPETGKTIQPPIEVGPSVIDFAASSKSERIRLFDADPDDDGPLKPDGVVTGQEVLDTLGLTSITGLTASAPYDDEALLALFDGFGGGPTNGLLEVGEVIGLLPVEAAAIRDAVISDDVDGDGKFDPTGFEVNTGGVPVYLDYDGNQRIGGSVQHAELAISEYVHVTGGIAFEKGPQQLVSIGTGFPDQVSGPVSNLLEPALDVIANTASLELTPTLNTIHGLDVATHMQFGASDVHAFVGAGGPYWRDLDRSGDVSWTTPDGTPVTTTAVVTVNGVDVLYGDLNGDGKVQANETAELSEDASGLWIEDFDFGYALFKTTLPFLDKAIPGFKGLKATADRVELVGVDDVTALFEGIEVNVNDGGNWFGLKDSSPLAVGPSVIDYAATFKSERIALFDTDPDGAGPAEPDGVVTGQEILDVLGLALIAGLSPATVFNDETLLALFDGTGGGQANGLLELGEVVGLLPVEAATVRDAVIAGDADGDGKLDPTGFEVNTGGVPVYLDYDGNQRIGGSLNYAELAISEFLHVTGSLAFEKGPQQLVTIGTGFPGVLSGSVAAALQPVLNTIANVPGLEISENLDKISGMDVSTSQQFGASGVHAFVGMGGPYWHDLDRNRGVSWTTPDGTPVTTGTVMVDGVEYGDINGDGTVQANETAELNEDATGLWIEDFDFGFASFSTTVPFLDRVIPDFTAIKASADRVELIGLDVITASLENILVEINNGGTFFNLPIEKSVIDFATTYVSERIMLFDTDPDGVGPLEPDGVITGQEVLDVLGLPAITGLAPADSLDDQALLELFDGMGGGQLNGLLDLGEVIGLLPVEAIAIRDLVIAGDKDHDGKLDPTGFEVNTGGVPIYLDYDHQPLLRASVDHAEIRISEFVHLSGSFAFAKGPRINAKLTSDDLIFGDEKELSVLSVGAEDVHLFVGAEGPYWKADLDNDRAISWVAPATDTGGNVIPDQYVSLTDGPDPDSWVDVVTVAGVKYGDIDQDGIVQANESAELDENAVGLVANNFDLGFALMKPTNPLDPARYIALKATLEEAKFVGVDEITAELYDIAIEVNLTDPRRSLSNPLDLAVVDFTALPDGKLPVKTGKKNVDGTDSSVDLTMDSALIAASINYAEIDLDGKLFLAGSAAFEFGRNNEVTLSDSSTKEVTRMTLSVHDVYGFFGDKGPYIKDWTGDQRITDDDIPTAANGFAPDAIGVSMEDLDFAAAIMVSTDPITDPGVYLAGNAVVDKVQLVGVDNVSLDAFVNVSLNLGFGVQGLSPIDWVASFNDVSELDRNGNGMLDPSEDANGNSRLDPGEDLNQNGRLDASECVEDRNCNGQLDANEDLDEDGVLDTSGFLIPTGGDPFLLDYTELFVSAEIAGKITVQDDDDNELFRVVGGFLLEMDGRSLELFANAAIQFGDPNNQILDIYALGALVLNDKGIAIDAAIGASVGSSGPLADVFSLKVDARAIVNTTGEEQEIEVSDRFAEILSGTRSLPKNPNTPAGVDTSELASESMSLFVDCKKTAGNNCYIINAGAPQITGVDANGNFVTTEGAPGPYFYADLDGKLKIGGDDGFGLEGKFALVNDVEVFQLFVAAKMEVFEAVEIDVQGQANIVKGVNGQEPGIVLTASASVAFDIAPIFTFKGDAKVRFNTRDSGTPDKFDTVIEGIGSGATNVVVPRDSLLVEISNAELNLLSVLTFHGSGRIELSDGVFVFYADVSASLFGVGSIAATGFFNSYGDFFLDASASVSLGAVGTGVFGDGAIHVHRLSRQASVDYLQEELSRTTYKVHSAAGTINVGLETGTAFSGRIEASAKFLYITLISGSIGIGYNSNSGELRLDACARITLPRFGLPPWHKVSKCVGGNVGFLPLGNTPPVPLLAGPVSDDPASQGEIAWNDSLGGTLHLNMGPRANLRAISADTEVTRAYRETSDEMYMIEVIKTNYNPDGSPRSQDLKITGLGFNQVYKNVSKVVADGGHGNDSILITNDGELVTLPVELRGGDGSDTLIYNGSGNAVIDGGQGDDELQGGTGINSFYFGDNWGRDVISEIGGTSGADSIDFSMVTQPIDLSLEAGNFSAESGENIVVGGIVVGGDLLDDDGVLIAESTILKIKDIIGGSGSDTLEVIPSGASNTSWEINQDNRGVVNGEFDFQSIESLVGGGNKDRFVLADGVGLDGTINGGGGIDTLDYGEYSSTVEVNRQHGTATNTSGFKNIDRAIAGQSNNDVLSGRDAVSTWNITTANTGDVSDGNFVFENFENLTGGIATDTFVLHSSAFVTGQINGSSVDGSADSDLIDLSDYTDALRVDVSANDAGTIGNPGRMFDFRSIENLTTGSGSDEYVFVDRAVISGNIDAGLAVADHFDFTAWTAPVTLNLALPDPQDQNLTVRAANVEHVTSGSASDLIDGNASANRLIGGLGDDTMNGAAGNDFIIGGFGDDVIDGGADKDVLFGGLIVGTIGDYDFASSSNFTVPPELAAKEARFSSNADPNRFGRPSEPNEPKYTPATHVTPVLVVSGSIDGVLGDGADIVAGGAGQDVLFGGSDNDQLYGDGKALDAQGKLIELPSDGADYVDAGAGNDLTIQGGGGEDVIRGGVGDDALDGGSGIDQLFGDEGNDTLFAGAGSNNVQAGQRLFGGPGQDVLFAFAPDVTATDLAGDQLFGGDGNDVLRGNTRRDVLVGDAGNDAIRGDENAGPDYVTNFDAYAVGATDIILGGGGNDVLLGGGGDDEIWGGLGSDKIDGQAGNDLQYGGTGIDFFVMSIIETDHDTLNGHFGNEPGDTTLNDNAIDVLAINGTNEDDTILIGAQAGVAVVHYKSGTAAAKTLNTNILDAAGNPAIEQFNIAGLGGDDTIGFITADAVAAGIPLPAGIGPLDLSALGNTREIVGALQGNSGNDLLIGADGRDELNGGPGSDVMYGFRGDDRLQGDLGVGSTSDHDVMFAGDGFDDLEGGQGRNEMYAWSFAPESRLVPVAGSNFSAGDAQAMIDDPDSRQDFGVFIDAQNNLFANDGDANLNGILDLDESTMGPYRLPYVHEVTGLNRILGGDRDDRLYGGTVLDFMFGNGGNDTLLRADGSTFESLDGGDGGDEWKEYARESDQVWYAGGTNADDEIRVDYVTEPGLLGDHHLITRLTNNNGNFSFDAQVRLDFSAVDGEGNKIWDARTALDLNELFAATDEEQSEQALADLETQKTELISKLLPPEGDFLVIIIDALDGNDRITVGPTVQKSVWIDAGDGDDVVEIRAGNAILVDKAEQLDGKAKRNDRPDRAFDLSGLDATGDFSKSFTFTGLSIDNPQPPAGDVDWFSFQLAADANAAGKIELGSGSPVDELGLQIFEATPYVVGTQNVDIDKLTSGTYQVSLDIKVGDDEGTIAITNEVISDLDALIGRLETLIDSNADLMDQVKAIRDGDKLTFVATGTAHQGILTVVDTSSDDVAGYASQRISDAASELREVTLVSRALGTPAEDSNEVLLTGLTAETTYLLKVSSPHLVPTLYDLRFNLNGTSVQTEIEAFETISLSLRSDSERRDVILGGKGDDILRGGAGEDWIFGGPGNDVLTGGQDRNARDLLIGGDHDDTFQIIPDFLPLLTNQPNTHFDAGTQTYIPTSSEQLRGGGGTDRVLFLGGDTDRRGFEVPDYTALRYNTLLHRYEFSSLLWDIGQQEFETTFIDSDQDGEQDASEQTIFKQQFMFYQMRDIEGTEFNLRSGDDVVRLDNGFKFLPVTENSGSLIVDPAALPSKFESWGINLGDFEQGAREAGVAILGGPGNDKLFGGVLADAINGGPGNDLLVGGSNNDTIEGEGGSDTIFGNRLDTSMVDDPYPLVTTLPDGFPASADPESYVYDLAAPFQNLTFFGRTGVNLNGGPYGLENNSFGLEGATTGERLTTFRSIGDFNGDAMEDFIASSDLTSYILFGPVELDDIQRVDQVAKMIVDQSALGRPAEHFGDVNDDGFGDLAFIREDLGDTLVTIVFGGPVANTSSGLDWPRDWDQSFVDNVLVTSGANRNSQLIRLPLSPLSESGVLSVQLLETTGDAYSDVLITADSTTGAQSPVTESYNYGYVYSGATISAASTGDLGLKDRLAKIRSTADLPALRALVAGDVNGDGIDETLFGSTTISVSVDAVTPAILNGTSSVSLFPGLSTKLTITLGTITEVLTVDHVDGPDAGTDLSASDLVEQINKKIENLDLTLAHLVEASLVDGSIRFTTDDGGSDVQLTVSENIDSHPLGFNERQQQTAPRNYHVDEESEITYQGNTIIIPERLVQGQIGLDPIVGQQAFEVYPGLNSELDIQYQVTQRTNDRIVDGEVAIRRVLEDSSDFEKEITIPIVHGNSLAATIDAINAELERPENLIPRRFYSTQPADTISGFLDWLVLSIDGVELELPPSPTARLVLHYTDKSPSNVIGFVEVGLGRGTNIGGGNVWQNFGPGLEGAVLNLLTVGSQSFDLAAEYSNNLLVDPNDFWGTYVVFQGPPAGITQVDFWEIVLDVPFLRASKTPDGNGIQFEAINTPRYHEGMSLTVTGEAVSTKPLGIDEHYGFGDLATTTSTDNTSVTVTSSDSVPAGLGTIQDIDVTLGIEHPRISELDVDLISPSGTRVDLFSNVSESFRNVTLDDGAAGTMSGSVLSAGTYRPEGNLADLIGEDPQGSWVLDIQQPKDSKVEPNNSIAAAQNVDPFAWSLFDNANIQNATTVPHASIAATDGGTYDFYEFTVNYSIPKRGAPGHDGGWIGTFDIDDNTFPSSLALFDDGGNQLDLSYNESADPGDSNTFASRITHEGSTYLVL